MGEEIAFENGQFSDFEGLVTLTLTLDRVILHTVMHHSSTSAYTLNFIEIKETFCGRTDIQTYRQKYGGTDGQLKPTLLGQLVGVDQKREKLETPVLKDSVEGGDVKGWGDCPGPTRGT